MRRPGLLAGVWLLGLAAARPVPLGGGRGKKPAVPPVPPVAHSVVLFVADGLGASQRRLARLVQATPLAMDAMPVVAMATPGSLDKPAPDTAAACTALATGHKTRDNLLSLDNATGQPLPTLLTAAHQAGLATGLITNLTVTHASVAGFAAHARQHDDEDAIAVQYETAGLDVLLGGGRRHFQPGGRADGQDVLGDFEHAGYKVLQAVADIDQPKAADKVLGLFAPGPLPYELDRPHGDAAEPSLATLTGAALSWLGQRPFVLVVNQGRLDWACHDRDPAAAEHEVEALDEAVQVALDFQQQHPDVLVVVVGSHETSGLAITPDFRPAAVRGARSSLEQTAAAVRKDRTHYDGALGTMLGWTDMQTDEREAVLVASDPAKGPPPDDPTNDPLLQTLSRIESPRCGVAWATRDHTAEACPLTAAGPGARTLLGQYDTTEVPRRLAHLLHLRLAP